MEDIQRDVTMWETYWMSHTVLNQLLNTAQESLGLHHLPNDLEKWCPDHRNYQ